MTTIAIQRIVNIRSFVLGDVTIKGIRSIDYTINPGKFKPTMEEGHLYPSGKENLGSEEFPVTGKVIFETSHANALTAQALATADATVTLKTEGGGGDLIRIFKNFTFGTTNGSQKLQDFGQPSMDFFCYSDDGDTLPIVDTD